MWFSPSSIYFWLTCHHIQAILSQFSKNKKATTDSDGDDAIISRLQEEDDDEEVDSDVDDDNDKINSAVEASNNAMVDNVV